MAPMNMKNLTHEKRVEIWNQWFEGKSSFRIVRNFRGTVTQTAVEQVLREAPPEELVQDPRFNAVHRYKVYAVDGLTNPLTMEPCLYIVLKLPDLIAPSQHSKGLRIIRAMMAEVGGYFIEYGPRCASIDEDLFIEAMEAGIPALQLDLAGRVTMLGSDDTDPDGDPVLVPVPTMPRPFLAS